jgi:hypothetical protein
MAIEWLWVILKIITRIYMKKIYTTILFLTAISCSVFGQTNVSGGIYTNTTWTLANSPYIVIDTVVVFPGVTLTIEPGVVVKFDSNVYLEIRQATLLAEGTASDSITFTANTASPSPGFWREIYLNSYSDTCKFNYCNIYYSDHGIMGGINEIINNSNFEFNNNGIYEGSASINSCNFKNNLYGIWGNSGYNISSCKFINNQYGMSAICNSKIKNCIINSNQTGIGPDGGYITIMNCLIDSNSIYGVNYTTDNNDSIINCQIMFNGTGINISMESIIILNDIEFNDIGIKVNYSNDVINCNKLCNNSLYDLYYNVPQGSNSSFPNNYWCTIDSASTEVVIYDGYDNINLGLVFFMTIDTLQCYLGTQITNAIMQSINFNIFPNPVSNNMTITLPTNNSTTEIKIYNMLGELAYSSTTTEQKTDIDISTLINGVYIIQITSSGKISRQKFIKQKQ